MKRFLKFTFSLVFWLAVFGAAAAYGIWRFLPESEPARIVGPYVELAQDKVLELVEKYWPRSDEAVDAASVASDDEPAAAPGDGAAAPDTKAPAVAKAEEKPAAKPARSVDPHATWTGLGSDDWYSGRKLSERDLKGKVVLVYEFDVASPDSLALLPRIQQTWTGFRHKPFVVIGSHRGEKGDAVKKAVAAKKVTFPVYQDFAFKGEPRGVSRFPYIFVVNAEGKLVYHGRSDCDATEASVTAFGFVR